MMTPTIHINGTGRDSLQQQYLNAIRAIDDALAVLYEAAPNARDYYPQQGSDAYSIAAQEHRSRVDRLGSVRDELETILEAVMEETTP